MQIPQMRLFLSVIAFFALFLTLTAATTTTTPMTATTTTTTSNVRPARGTMSLFRPWTWALALPALAEPDAAALHVRRHGPRRRAVHP
ncbi:hypothetical protein B0H15DRAFT_832918 [Mycena belliarum]|uniref:Secreted protein n=1 Tax=Mycena belliarum TaxID=1033014 RepID=A0AAD6U9Z9_9AGAR|nr:hypothetical protein B0H15DRAFT_832918 [Mycena belliae]